MKYKGCSELENNKPPPTQLKIQFYIVWYNRSSGHYCDFLSGYALIKVDFAILVKLFMKCMHT